MDSLNAYRSQGDQPITRQSVCGYLDVLGFTAAVRDAERSGRSNDLLKKFAFLVRNWFSSLGDIIAIESREPRRKEYKIFTDNVIVGEPIEVGSGAELAYTISDLALLQVGLMVDGFFVRGGVSVGNLYMDEDILYGSAALDAHDAEQLAKSPRIVLHATATSVVREHVAHYMQTYGESRGHRFTDAVLVDEDGLWFVNYLAQIFDRGMFDPDYETLQTHAVVVQQRLREHEHDEHIRAKYVWAARYHNYFCTTILDGEEYALDVGLPVLGASAIEDVIRQS